LLADLSQWQIGVFLLLWYIQLKCKHLIIKGFVCGWSYWFARAISFGLQLTALHNIMSTWVEDKYKYLWISFFFILIVLFNLLNVRRYGEIEFWFTVIKLVTIVGLIFLGLILAMGALGSSRQLGTLDNTAIPCPNECLNTAVQQGLCLDIPGFGCMYGKG
jgi:L-asparagine transporter-like permease